MTIYISGPDGKTLTFASDAELDAYRRAQREAEPPLLRCLRKHRSEVFHLRELAQAALAQRRGRTAALAAIELHLCSLNHAMVDDIQAARDQAN